MTSPTDPAADLANEAAPEPAAPGRSRASRRRIDEVFGDVLPDTTNDERTPGQRGGFSEAHYRDQRPPHHVPR